MHSAGPSRGVPGALRCLSRDDDDERGRATLLFDGSSRDPEEPKEKPSRAGTGRRGSLLLAVGLSLSLSVWLLKPHMACVLSDGMQGEPDEKVLAHLLELGRTNEKLLIELLGSEGE